MTLCNLCKELKEKTTPFDGADYCEKCYAYLLALGQDYVRMTSYD